MTFSIMTLRTNDTKHNDIQHNDTKHIDIQHDDTQHKGLICDTQRNGTHNKVLSVKTPFVTTLSIMTISSAW
jgi:hypothetical protein